MTASLRTRLTSLWAAAVPSPQMHRPQWSSVVGSSVQSARAVHPVAAGAVVGLCVVQERSGLAGEAVQRAVRLGLSGGDNEHPGHVVGAVAVLGRGSVRRACSKVARWSVIRSRWANTGAWHGGGHARARRRRGVGAPA